MGTGDCVTVNHLNPSRAKSLTGQKFWLIILKGANLGTYTKIPSTIYG